MPSVVQGNWFPLKSFSYVGKETGRLTAVTKPTAVLFDLDGTLADTIELILRSFEYTLERVCGRSESRELISSWIGRTLMDTFDSYCPEKSDELLRTYRAWNEQRHDDYVKPFPQICELISALSTEHYNIGIATAKLRPMAERGVRAVGLDGLIEVYVAGDDCDKHKPDPTPLLVAFEKMDADLSGACYVGDAKVDMLAAKAAGVKAIGVTWGAGTRTDLIAGGADVIVDSVTELAAVLGIERLEQPH